VTRGDARGTPASSGCGPDVTTKAFTAGYVLGQDGGGNEGLVSLPVEGPEFPLDGQRAEAD